MIKKIQVSNVVCHRVTFRCLEDRMMSKKCGDPQCLEACFSLLCCSQKLYSPLSRNAGSDQ